MIRQLPQENAVGDGVKGLIKVQLDNVHSLPRIEKVAHMVIERDQLNCSQVHSLLQDDRSYLRFKNTGQEIPIEMEAVDFMNKCCDFSQSDQLRDLALCTYPVPQHSLFDMSPNVLLGTAEAEFLVAGTRDKQSVIFRLEVASLETSIEAGL
ncbi:hypothetical protein llap_11388 [Limosa lapponica baueri]|uniref:Uncharacterized protein n=1 Tax=Limosa lapponica baueri TaxID=1758121 RepID=A0A2I0TWV3_LIMLA|nr:hypothetical protein llap_11388 [Limosa lapponica baueri]